MRNKVMAEKQTVANEQCRHYWVIESPMGAATSRGVCRLCGAEREFRNSWYDLNASSQFNGGTRTNKLSDEEIDVG